mgnify:CR=1 FL=1
MTCQRGTIRYTLQQPGVQTLALSQTDELWPGAVDKPRPALGHDNRQALTMPLRGSSWIVFASAPDNQCVGHHHSGTAASAWVERRAASSVFVLEVLCPIRLPDLDTEPRWRRASADLRAYAPAWHVASRSVLGHDAGVMATPRPCWNWSTPSGRRRGVGRAASTRARCNAASLRWRIDCASFESVLRRLRRQDTWCATLTPRSAAEDDAADAAPTFESEPLRGAGRVTAAAWASPLAAAAGTRPRRRPQTHPHRVFADHRKGLFQDRGQRLSRGCNTPTSSRCSRSA